MARFGKILVAVEPSDGFDEVGEELTGTSQQALARATWLANRTGAELTIFSTVAISPFIEDLVREQLTNGDDRPTRATEALLKRCVAKAKKEGVAARSVVSTGIPWQEICRHVEAETYDVVIAGTRDLGRVGRVLFGSTGMKLLRNCSAPVWITRPGAKNDQFTILVPTDFSSTSLDALRMALEIADGGRACIHLLHVLDEPFSLPAWFGHASPQLIEDYIAKRRAQMKKMLHDQLSQAGKQPQGLEVHVHIFEGPADETILQAIDDLKINLVVMGTAARAGLARAALGNTAERLVSHMKCSLIAVKPRGFHRPLPTFLETDARQSSSAGV